MKDYLKSKFTKDNIKKVILHPLTCIILRSIVLIICFCVLGSIVGSNPVTLTDNEDFILGTKFGVYMSIFVWSLLCFPFDFLSLGIYVQKKHNNEDVDNG